MTNSLRWTPERFQEYQKKSGAVRPSVAIVEDKKPSKYRNRQVKFEGQAFDSEAECRRYQQLMALQRAGAVTELTRQVSFVLAPKTVIQGKPKRSLIYRADFSYIEAGQRIVEDVKGKLTKEYIIKRHLMMTVHGIEIRETK